ncbi:hypothetical protein, partial [Paracoccus sp. (in: a-proteobacteria)]|uniref:hypothetical protein n=1 Tax=Paracoccus sp. TaxID=267 RepID=UPI0028A89824
GRRHQHGAAMGGKRLGQLRQYGVDGQLHSRLMAKPPRRRKPPLPLMPKRRRPRQPGRNPCVEPTSIR